MRLIAFLTAALLVLASQPGTAAANGHRNSIEAVIESQLSAFQRNDLPAAFSHASPSIQTMFGSPDNFGKMVRRGYPMVWRPAGHRMVKLLETSAGPVQVVLFEDASGRMHEAGYLMEEIDGVWRINGVHLRAVPGVGT